MPSGDSNHTHSTHKTHKRNQLRLRTVGELVATGWDNSIPHYDAALACPSCEYIIKKKSIVPMSGESQTKAAKRVLYTDEGGFEALCPNCDVWFFRNTTVVYNYFAAKEGVGEPSFPYTVHDLPIDLEGYDPGPFTAAVLMRHLHNQADDPLYHTEAEHVNWGMDQHLLYQCPLCTTTDCEFEPHYWKYDPDISVSLCPDCHDTIHKRIRSKNQSSAPCTAGDVNQAIAVLVSRHRLNRGLPSADASFWEIKHRYNIPFGTERIKSAYNQRYGDCEHEYVTPPHCDHCGEIVDSPPF